MYNLNFDIWKFGHPQCANSANGAFSNLHVGHNSIPEEQMKSIIAMNKFDVLCAVPVKELKANSITELDLSGKSLGTEGALVLATYMEDNGTLVNLNISNNSVGPEGAQALVPAM